MFKFFIDPEKEEAWLDDMADRGLMLKSVVPSIGWYKFDKVPEGEYCPKVRIDWRVLKKDERDDYFEMFEKSGWENICSTNFSAQQYFRQRSADADTKNFSDEGTMEQRNLGVSILSLVIGIICVALMIFPVYSLIDCFRNSEYVIGNILLSSVAAMAVLSVFIISQSIKCIRRNIYKRNNTPSVTERSGTGAFNLTLRRYIGIVLILSVVCGGSAFTAGVIAAKVFG